MRQRGNLIKHDPVRQKIAERYDGGIGCATVMEVKVLID